METKRTPLSELHPAEDNPRSITDRKFNQLIDSLLVLPKMLELRPIVHDGTGTSLGGNMRLRALTAIAALTPEQLTARLSSLRDFQRKSKAQQKSLLAWWMAWLAAPTAPAIAADELTEGEKREFIIKDNASFGDWDWDKLSTEWDTSDLQDWGLDVWDDTPAEENAGAVDFGGGLSTRGREGDEEYNAFVDKFKQKLTTDDCYTPAPVYDAVLDFVRGLTPLQGREVVRPFYPGGDYENLTQYPKGCIVVDNPPFSILSKIVRFFCANGIDFFIFGPALTLFTAADCDVTYLVANCYIEYENGAVVRTGFITNIIPDLRIWCCPQLKEAVEAAQEKEDATKQLFVYPDNIVTAATLGKLTVHATELRIRKKSCEYIKESDSAKEQGRSLYGGGFILSDRAAAERAAAERAAAERAAAERAAATRLNLSEREREIIARLDAQDTD